MSKKYAIVMIATNNYFPLGIRFISRLKHFCNDLSNVDIHIAIDEDKSLDFFNDLSIFCHKQNTGDWDSGTLLKFDICKKIAEEYDYEYIVCIDADTNIYHNFNIDDIFATSFILKHINNLGVEGNSHHYESNINSIAYVSPEEYQDIYYQACYFGGTKQNMLDMVNFGIKLKNIDIENGVLATWADEGYLQKYFIKNPPDKIFDPHDKNDFPFFVGDRGFIMDCPSSGKYTKPFETISPEEYEDLVKNIILLEKDNIFWDIKKDHIFLENS